MIVWTIVLILLIAYQVVLSIYYPVLLSLTTKFKDLSKDNRKLLREIDEVKSKSSVKLSKIVVIDDKRYRLMIAGFGKYAAVIVSEYALQGSSRARVASLFAHELGHYYYNHHVKGLAISIIKITLSIIPCMILSFYVMPIHIYYSICIMIFFSLMLLIQRVVIDKINVKQELQADKYACGISDIDSLIKEINAATIVSVKNVRSHPVIKTRLEHLIKYKNDLRAIKKSDLHT
jgi:Zn-dependent protease with chaperone function